METEFTHNVKFKVSLSNGETLYEGKGDYKEIENELSPWQRLLLYTSTNNLEITSLSLYTDNGQTFNLPSAGKNPKFKIWGELEQPLDYNLFRMIAKEKDFNNGVIGEDVIVDWFTGIEAIYPTHKLQLWINECNTQNCWVCIVNL